jgi:CheY-like chemotaxis protein
VLADATQIEQVLLNLATNSMQALKGRRGSISIRLELARIDPELISSYPSLRSLKEIHPNGTVRLSVTDDGPGMDAATRQRVFEPFFTTKPVDEGTGLGLSVVHGIVQGHRGEIVVKSQPGEGTTFSIFLPAMSSSEATATLSATPVLQPPDRTGSAYHVLYLDDDNAVLILVKRLLERRGYRVSCFSDQNDALNALRACPADFDVVVTDFNMPGMHGLEVAREVRAIRPDLPVAVTSGFVDEELQAGVHEAGIRRLIAKPFAMDDLYSAIQSLVES